MIRYVLVFSYLVQGPPHAGQRLVLTTSSPHSEHSVPPQCLHLRWLAERKGFSAKYGSFGNWREQRARSSAYVDRIQRYMEHHPHTTSAEARGHRRK
jgi:hypothetical protein